MQLAIFSNVHILSINQNIRTYWKNHKVKHDLLGHIVKFKIWNLRCIADNVAYIFRQFFLI